MATCLEAPFTVVVGPSIPDVIRIRSHDGVGESVFLRARVFAFEAYLGVSLRTRSRNTSVSEYSSLSAFRRTVEENHLYWVQSHPVAEDASCTPNKHHVLYTG